ncbi:pyruvate kinase [Prochlorococcus sp. MIT 1341]|uniref:pyruvate kinase n=1 Tax=Prochlorococcus sp. MIT 1341 TaxID=3096221 RepID=UPI002A75E909|nr:pyruvate kinase [Prochlorococcus sp. MIT 1341]
MANFDLARRTKIVATIGPATEEPERIKELIRAGATTFRLNFSHGDHNEHAKRIKTIRRASDELGVHIGILQDLQGPKIRLGRFKDGPISLNKGDIFTLTSKKVECNHDIATVTYEKLANEVTVGSRILLDDGRVEMKVEKVLTKEQKLKCLVTVGGVLSNNKGVNFPDVQLSVRALTTKDKEDLSFGLNQGVDWIALSFVRNPSDMKEIKKLIHSQGHSTPVIAKVEKFEAIDQIDAILPLCDGVMVARGDLGVEMPAEEVPLLQKDLIRKANSLGIPIITATQMLDSMASCPRPTRAEVSDVANAILDGTDAVMLSNETAVGEYPVEAVATMATIAMRIERDYPQRALDSYLECTIPNAISAAVSSIASQLNAAAILPLTKSGATAHNVSKFRPPTPILAITNEAEVARRLQIVWGVTPLLIATQKSSSKTFNLAMGIARKLGLLKDGDIAVQTAGTLEGVSGSTNLLKVEIVRPNLPTGKGIGMGNIKGKVKIYLESESTEKKGKEYILVTPKTDNDLTEEIKESSAVITEDEDEESNVVRISKQLGIPIILGVKGAVNQLKSNEFITLEIEQGLIHRNQDPDIGIGLGE